MDITLAGPIDTNMLRRLSGRRLLDAPNGQGGAPVSDLAAGLLRLGHRVRVVTLDSTIVTSQTFHDGDLSITYVPWRAPPRYRTRTRMFDLFEVEIRGLTAAIREFDSHLVHAHWSYEYAEAAIRSRYPHLVTLHDLGWNYLWIMRDAYRLMRLVMKFRVMIRAKFVTVVAPFMQDRLWNYGYFGKSHVVPNGIVLPELSDFDISSRLEAPIRYVTIGNSGTIKNVRASVTAFRSIRERLPNAELHLFGPGLGSTFASDEINVYGHDNVAHEELMAFLRDEATVLIHPSRIEACPVIIAEAKAFSLPVVGGRNSGGVPFVCGNSAGSILVDIENSDEIAEAALSIVSSPERYQKMARAARKDTELRFASNLVTLRYVGIYEEMLQKWNLR